VPTNSAALETGEQSIRQAKGVAGGGGEAGGGAAGREDGEEREVRVAKGLAHRPETPVRTSGGWAGLTPVLAMACPPATSIPAAAAAHVATARYAVH
jgi:hypothetical protein